MKKVLSVFLVLVLLMSSMPFFSVAEDGTAEDAILLQDAGEGNDLPEDEEPLEPGTVFLIAEDLKEIDPEEPVAEEPVVEEPAVEEPVVEEPVVEEPVVEEPVAEEPVVEEPVVEEPVVEEPVVEEPVVEEPMVEEPVGEKPVAEEPVVEEPVAEKPVAEEPVVEEPVVEEPARFEQGYVQVKKDTVVYAEANKKEEAGTFAEDAIVYAKLDTQRDDPAKDWLKINFAVETDGQKTVETGFIQAESMKVLLEVEIAQLTAKLDQDTQAPEHNGHKLPIVKFEKVKEEATPVKEPGAVQPAEQKEQEAQAESSQTEGEDGEVGGNKSALPTVKITAYSYDGYMKASVAVSNASGEVGYTWYVKNSAGKKYNLGTEKSVKFSASNYLNYQLYCSVHVNGLNIDTSSVNVVGTPYISPSYQNTAVGEICYFSCYGVPADATVSYQWQVSKDGGKTWKSSDQPGNKTSQLGIEVNTGRLEFLYRCAVKVNGTMTYTNSVYMIAAVASPSTASGKINTTVKFSVKCENATGDVSYQWQVSKDKGDTWTDSDSTGNNTKTLSVEVNTARTKFLYRCKVTSNTGTVYSNSVKVKGIFSATASPERKAAKIGSNVKFTTTPYFSSGTVTYQWQYSTDNGKTWKNSSQTGSKTKTLTVNLTEARLINRYRCAVKAGGKTVYTNTVKIFSAKATPKEKQVAIGDTVTFTEKAYNSIGTVKYQWQYSADDGKTWSDSLASGAKTKTLSLKVTKTNIKYQYRCKVTDKNYTVYTNTVKMKGALSASIAKGSTGAAIGSTVKFITTTDNTTGTVKYTWQYSDDGKTWTNSTSLSGKTPSITLYEKYLARLYRCVVEDSTGKITTNSIRLIDFTLASTKPVYRALLIGERNFSPYCARNGGDVVHMASMLGKVRGPGGSKYKVTQKFDLRWSEIRTAIQTTFADTKDTDVSLFMIASHGAVNISSGEAAGAISTMDWSLYFSELADWFNTYCKGKVIVIIESCGSGSGIYKEGVTENGMILANAADEKLVQSAVSAFASADPGITMETTDIVENGDGEISVNTGELRTSKYYVLAAARHMELSYGLAETGSASTQDQSGNVFIYGLVEGVGSSSSSPADKSPKNRVITLEESYSYCVSFAKAWSKYLTEGGVEWDPGVDPYEAQHTQRYPKNSKYPLFIFP